MQRLALRASGAYIRWAGWGVLGRERWQPGTGCVDWDVSTEYEVLVMMSHGSVGWAFAQSSEVNQILNDFYDSLDGG